MKLYQKHNTVKGLPLLPLSWLLLKGWYFRIRMRKAFFTSSHIPLSKQIFTICRVYIYKTTVIFTRSLLRYGCKRNISRNRKCASLHIFIFHLFEMKKINRNMCPNKMIYLKHSRYITLQFIVKLVIIATTKILFIQHPYKM